MSEKEAPSSRAREETMPIGVILRRSPGGSRWAKWRWRVVGVLPGAGAADGRLLRSSGEGAAATEERHAATLTLTLHRADVEAYQAGLANTPPLIWVILRTEGVHAEPTAHFVTASPFEAQDYADSGEEIVEAVPAPPPVVAWISDFTAAHWREEPFKKRRRDRVAVEKKEDGVGDPRVRQDADVYRAPGALKPRRPGDGQEGDG